MTLITLSAFALISLAGIAATVKAVATDGYRRVPVRRPSPAVDARA